jgi:Spy/CpxP family protein refolding chaperone
LSSLSDEQVEKLHNLHNQYLDELGPKSIELASKSRKLKDILLANSINESEAKALQSDINKIKDEIANLKLEHHIAMASILTVDQKKEMRESIYRGPLEHMARHHHMGGWEKHPHMSSSLNSEWHGDK